MTSLYAKTVVFVASAAVLVLEILAGRLMAPYVGVSLETFTGIIGTVLAGIALGSAVGGRLADKGNPVALIAGAYGFGGILAWASIPIIAALGPGMSAQPASIVALTATAFFAPAAALSAVTPMAAKAHLTDLDETGAVIGDLSASSTAGALCGTFLTGFVLVAALPTSTIILIVGSVLVVGGLLIALRLTTIRPSLGAVVLGAAALAGGLVTPSRCEEETAYNCVRIETDADNSSGRSVYINYLRNSYVDIDDPTNLGFRYTRLFGAVVDAMPPGPLRAVHIGGAGVAFPRYVAETRPGSNQVVLEIDGGIIALAERDLGLVVGQGIDVVIGDARLALGDLETDAYDFIVGDAFSGITVPWHLTTSEVVAEFDRLLVDNGIYIMNLIDGGESRFARAQLATLEEHFDYLGVVIPIGDTVTRSVVNQVLIASDTPIPRVDISFDDGQLFTGSAISEFIDGANVLTDDFAPVDQLTKNE